MKKGVDSRGCPVDTDHDSVPDYKVKIGAKEHA
jgi:hypothetical protein